MVSQNWGGGYLFVGPHSKDYSILGSILGYPNVRKLAYELWSRLLKRGIGGYIRFRV